MATWKLKVDGEWVFDSSNNNLGISLPVGFSGIDAVKFERAYDEPSMVSFILVGNFRPLVWNAGTLVELWRDNVRIFEGKTNLPARTITARNEMGLAYTAYDRRRDTANDTARTTPEVLPGFPEPTRVPHIELPAGALSEAVDALIAHVGQDLNRIGLSTTVNYIGGAADIETRGCVLDEASIDQAFMELAARAPGVRVFVDPSPGGAPRYTFVNLFGAAAHTLYMDEQRLASLDVRESIDGCCGAVVAYEGITSGLVELEFANSLRLEPAWDAAREVKWSERRKGGMAMFTGGGDDEADFKCFRCYSFAEAEDSLGVSIPRTGKVTAFIYRTGNPDAIDEVGNFSGRERVAILKIDYENRLVYLAEPVVRGDTSPSAMQCPGVTRRAGQGSSLTSLVSLAWNDPGSASVDITIEGIRYPESGFAGRAYAADSIYAGVEHHIEAPPGIDRRRFAAQAWTAYSEPSFSGTIPFNEEPPVELLFLARRINIATRNSGGTGFEVERAPIMGITVEFGTAITGEARLSRDASSLLSGGTA